MTTVRLIKRPQSWVDGEALDQLQRSAQQPGVWWAVGLPDLHAGPNHPIGAAFISDGVVHPGLVGSDIGCGMTLFQSDNPAAKCRVDRLADRLRALELSKETSSALGTVGGGNHFVELQRIASVIDHNALERYRIDASKMFVLVHAGSRGLGKAVHERFVQARAGLCPTGAEGSRYLRGHDAAVAWAKLNRKHLGRRVGQLLSMSLSPLVDITHNAVLPVVHDRQTHWLHRKGAAPSDCGPIVIPGSRGAATYLVQPIGGGADTGWSLAHGAGRRWKRSAARNKLAARYRPIDLQRTALGSRVICEDRALLYEEAPEAYKNIDEVVECLEQLGLLKVIAKMLPIVTYKTARTGEAGRSEGRRAHTRADRWRAARNRPTGA